MNGLRLPQMCFKTLNAIYSIQKCLLPNIFTNAKSYVLKNVFFLFLNGVIFIITAIEKDCLCENSRKPRHQQSVTEIKIFIFKIIITVIILWILNSVKIISVFKKFSLIKDRIAMIAHVLKRRSTS